MFYEPKKGKILLIDPFKFSFLMGYLQLAKMEYLDPYHIFFCYYPPKLCFVLMEV